VFTLYPDLLEPKDFALVERISGDGAHSALAPRLPTLVLATADLQRNREALPL
jgi:hypothetical protein